MAVNNRGEVVGVARRLLRAGSCSPREGGFVWDTRSGIRDLNQLIGPLGDLSIINAYDINDRGQILVIAQKGSEPTDIATALLTPTLAPEIDIKPGSDTNPINPMSRGVIPVAIRLNTWWE